MQTLLPDLDRLGLKWPKAKAAIDKVHAIRRRHAAAAELLDQLIGQRPEVEARDRRALAAAIAADKPDPGQGELQEHDQRIAAAKRQTEAATLAVDTAEAELAAVIGQHKLADVDALLEADRQALREAVEAWAEARRRLHEHRALGGWLLDPTRSYQVRTPGLRGIQTANGDALPMDVILAALLAEAEPPRQEAEAA